MSDAPARAIFIIRHGEKPSNTPPPYGVDITGVHNGHSLLALGWQRAGALATLFAPSAGHPCKGLEKPAQLISPQYSTSIPTHRTYQTIYPLSQLIGVTIENPYPEGQESTLGETVAAATSGVTLICWEHHALPKIAESIGPVAGGTKIPKTWPGNRFDVVWCFVREASTSAYVFSQVPQMLLDGDSKSPIKH
jgi:hypothetical protein